jgi:hypothetical protein
VAGAAIGIAGTIRTDLLVFAAAAPLILLKQGSFRQAIVGTAVSGVTALATLFAIYASVGATPFQAIRAGKLAVDLWGRELDFPIHIFSLLFFCGIPVSILIVAGGSALARQRTWLRMALLLGVPLLVNLLLVGRMWEVRQFLPQAPFLGAVALYGLAELASTIESHRPALIMAAAVLVLSLLVPIGPSQISDGPRRLTGRLVGLNDWFGWQAAVRANFATIDDVIESAGTGERMIVLANAWNEERYLHLELQKAGFLRQPTPLCDKIGAVWIKNGRTIIAINLQQSFLPDPFSYYPARLEYLAAPCWKAVEPRRAVLVTDIPRLLRELGQVPARSDARFGVSAMVSVPITFPGIEKMMDFYRNAFPTVGRERMEWASQQTQARVGWMR